MCDRHIHYIPIMYTHYINMHAGTIQVHVHVAQWRHVHGDVTVADCMHMHM